MEEVVGYLFNLEVKVPEQPKVGIVRDAQGRPIVVGGQQPRAAEEVPAVEDAAGKPEGGAAVPLQAPGLAAHQPSQLTYTAPDEDGAAIQSTDARTQVRSDDPFAGVGRNELCPCGSGKKYKYCHGRKA